MGRSRDTVGVIDTNQVSSLASIPCGPVSVTPISLLLVLIPLSHKLSQPELLLGSFLNGAGRVELLSLQIVKPHGHKTKFN